MSEENLYIKNNLEYKLAVKSLMLKYPFITGIYKVGDDDIYSLIFIYPYIDISYLAHMYGVEVKSYIKYWISKNEGYTATSISNFFEIDDEDIKNKLNSYDREMDKFLRRLHDSPSIPSEHKLPKQLSTSVFATELKNFAYPNLVKYIHT